MISMRASLLGVSVMLATLFGLSGPAFHRDDSSSLAEAYRLVNSATRVCGYTCSIVSCGVSFGPHEVWDEEADAYGPDHPCMFTTLYCAYHACENRLPADALDRLVELLPALKPEELARLAQDQAAVLLNRERHAIQVTGCNDLIVAHVPMSSLQAAALS